MEKIRQLEATYELFESLEEMLAPRVLSELVQMPVSEVKVIRLGDNGGLSGSRFSAIETDTDRYFLKQTSPDDDFIMMASDDVQCRSVRLWQYGLLDEIRPFLAHKIIGCARDGDSWAILMEDLQDALFSDNRPFTEDHFFQFLDALARMHAAFWGDARLADPALGLMDTAARVTFLSPLIVERYLHRTKSPIPQWIIGGWQTLPKLVPPETYRTIHDLIVDPQPLVDAIARYPCTLTHGDYRRANFAYNRGHCIAFDWQMAANTLMTANLAWYIYSDYEALTAIGIEKVIATYRARLESYLQKRFDEHEWQEMLDLGFAADAVRSMWHVAFFVTVEESPQRKNLLRQRVESHAHYVMKAKRWMS